jgi:hypothetical protein
MGLGERAKLAGHRFGRGSSFANRTGLIYSTAMKLRVFLPLLVIVAVIARLAFYKLMAIPFGGLSTAMCQYDCGWYVRLAMEGYGSDSLFADYNNIPNWAFFPLFPFILRAAVAVIGMGPYFVGLLVSNAFFALFIQLGAWHLRRTRAVGDPVLWVIFAVLFPFSFTFSAIYSESLFAVLVVSALGLLQTRRPLAASGVTALMCLTRPTGIIMLPVIIFDRGMHLWHNRHRTDRAALLGETLLPIAIAPLGLSLYMLGQYLAIGDAMAFNHVQILWDRVWVGPVATVVSGLGAWDWGRLLLPKGLQSESYFATWALLGLAVAVWLAIRRRSSEAWLLGVSILLPLSTGLHSTPRFVATNPFFLFAVFDLVLMLRSQRVVAAMFGTAGLLHGIVLVFWFISASSTY